MQITLNIIVSLAFMFWPFIFMMSPMMLDAPGSENNKANLTFIVLLLSYPIGISLLLWLFGGNYFGVNGLVLSIISTIVVVIAFSIFGYFGMLSNLARGIANSGYSIADNRVYYDGKLIEGADSGSFVILENDRYSFSISRYARDENYFYNDGVIVEGVISDNLQKTDINGDTYWQNSTQIIYGDQILAGANPDSFAGFEGFGGWAYSISNEQYFVYIYGKRLPDVDRKSFTPLNEFIAKDKNHIFEKENIILLGADAQSFELCDDHDFGKDNDHVYYMAHLQPFSIKDIDVESFEILDRGFLRDRNHIYYTHQYKSIEKLEQVDAASFEVTAYDESTNSDARDKNHYYYGEKIMGNRTLLSR